MNRAELAAIRARILSLQSPEQRKQWERTLNDKGRVPFIIYPNMCAKCGKLWPEMFSVPDKEWERYVEKGERDKMLCKLCYDQIKIWIDESRGPR